MGICCPVCCCPCCGAFPRAGRAQITHGQLGKNIRMQPLCPGHHPSQLLERNGASRAQQSGAGGSPAESSTYLSLGKAAGMWHKGNCYSPGPPDESGINTPLCCLTRLLGGGGPIIQQSWCRRVHFHPDLSQPDASSCPATPPQPSDCSLAAARTEPGTRQSIME